ncbi:MAG: ribosome silencing factor [Planctomycetes bacterium]|nr:ribosome silencing factor [Planctomycetota bacterium]
MALQLAERLDQKQAVDIRILDVSGPLVIADYFVVATVQSTRQAQSLAKELDVAHKAARGRRKRNGGNEGADTSWVLLDFNDIVVHLFLPDARDYYGLESLWADVPRLDFTPTARPQTDAGSEIRQPTLDGFGAFQPLDEASSEGDAAADDDHASGGGAASLDDPAGSDEA